MTLRVYRARWVLPISTPVIRNGAVAVADGRITWVGPAGEAPEGTPIELGDAALLPGLVNTHTHLELTAMRGFLEGLEFRDWVVRLTRARARVMTPERPLAPARVGLDEGLLAGVTTYADCSDAGEVLAAMRETGVRGIVYQEVFGPDPAIAQAAMRDLRGKVDRLRAGATSRVTVGVSPHAPYSVSDALFRLVADYARAEALPMAVHASESEAEHQLVSAGTGPFAEGLRGRGIAVAPRAATTVALLAATGVLGARTLLIHGVHLSASDIATVADAGTALAHCPASNARLGHGIAPLDDVQRAGIAVGLGTDSVASNNRMDLLDEARVASLMQRVRAGRPAVLSAPAAVALATLGGARALGLDRVVGSLEAGKAADLAAFALDGPGDAATYEPGAALVFGTAGRRARLVLVDGRELVRDGRLVRDAAADRVVVSETAAALGSLGRGT